MQKNQNIKQFYFPIHQTASYTYYSDGLASKTIGTIQLSITMMVIMLLMKR